MPVTITIHGDNAKQALFELAGLSAGITEAMSAPAPEQLTAEPVPDDERKTFPEATKPKRAAKSKPIELEEVAVPEVAAEPEAPLPDAAPAESSSTTSSSGASAPEAETSSAASAADAKPEFSEDDVRKALVDLGSQANGKENCRAVLTQFNATKISEVKVEDRKAFIAAIAKLRGVA